MADPPVCLGGGVLVGISSVKHRIVILSKQAREALV
jgi:hypothetical protein